MKGGGFRLGCLMALGLIAVLASPDGAGLEAAEIKEVTIREHEFTFEPAALTLKGGRVTFRVINDGKLPHGFLIEGQGVEKRIDLIMPGETATLEVELSTSGEYVFWCPIPGHRNLGMEGQVTIHPKTKRGRGR